MSISKNNHGVKIHSNTNAVRRKTGLHDKDHRRCKSYLRVRDSSRLAPGGLWSSANKTACLEADKASFARASTSRGSTPVDLLFAAPPDCSLNNEDGILPVCEDGDL